VPGYLLDANVLIALAWPEHTAYEKCSRWFGQNARAGWATCPITQAALVRILSNPTFSERALSPSEALQVLSQNLELAGHQFWSDSIDLRQAMESMRTSLTGHQQITDAYLVALAIHNRGKLATLDRKIVQLAPAGSVEVVA
jgi:toxin-antitoxin system PIN domain toxin